MADKNKQSEPEKDKKEEVKEEERPQGEWGGTRDAEYER